MDLLQYGSLGEPTYEITVTNPNHVSKGIAQITVDGQPITGSIVPVFDDGQVHEVSVVMGVNQDLRSVICATAVFGSSGNSQWILFSA